MNEYNGRRKLGVAYIMPYNTFTICGTYFTFDTYFTFRTYSIYIVLTKHIDSICCLYIMVKTMRLSNDLRKKIQHQVLYVIPVTSILGRLPVVPVCENMLNV